ncbi:MAG: hypothetical protein ABIR54_00970 [Burkholderiaceae bacterium]
MNNAPARTLVALALCLPALAHAQVPATPAPWQAVVDGIALGKRFELPSPGLHMQPLEYRRRPSQVPLVVQGRDEPTGTFCHGSMIAPLWMLTAASCVCSSTGEVSGMEVLLERATGTAPARRRPIVSSAAENRIWLYQTSAEATPRNCLRPPAGAPSAPFETDADLALVYLGPTQAELATPATPVRSDDAHSAIPGDLPVMDMLGSDTAPSSILASVAEGALDTGGGTLTAESVVLAQQAVTPSSGPTYRVAHPFLQSAPIVFDEGSCGLPAIEVASVATGAPGTVRTVRACANIELGGRPSALQGLEGTGVALSDHRRPLLLGVRGAAGTYTRLAQNAPTGKTIAQSALEFMQHQAPDDKQWFPLHPLKPPTAPDDPCRMSLVATIDGVDVYQYAIMNKGVAYFYRQREVWVSVRGAPRSYHPKDLPDTLDASGHVIVKGALDKKENAGVDGHGGTGWHDVLARRRTTDPQPYEQNREDPAVGFYVSMTKLARKDREDYDPLKYVDAEQIPYVVMSKTWADPMRGVGVTGNVGDYAAAVGIVKDANGSESYGRVSGAIVADVIDRAPIGGLSLALARRLNELGDARKLDPDPVHGVKPQLDVMFMVFPGTGSIFYRGQSAAAIDNIGRKFLSDARNFPPLTCFKQ